MPASSTPALEFNRVTKTYRRGLWPRRNVRALRDVTLAVPRGSLFGLLGPNRAGKTTLVKVGLSLCRPTSGTALRFGRPIWDRRTLARVGYVHDSQAFPPYLTARELLAYYGALSQLAHGDVKIQSTRLLAEVGLEDRADEPIASFSKGMLQRLALAQSLLNDPDLLVLDEPAEGMDLLARHMLHNLLRGRQKRGKTAVLVSHGIADVESLCDEVAVLRNGEVAFNGRLDDLVGSNDHSPAALESALEPLYAGATA
jgi:ABC-2 type transport system ATP-binding protein